MYDFVDYVFKFGTYSRLRMPILIDDYFVHLEYVRDDYRIDFERFRNYSIECCSSSTSRTTRMTTPCIQHKMMRTTSLG